MLNRITITGRLTHDPELRTTQSGISVVTFSLANQRNYKNSAGERDTDFFNVTAWRSTAEFVSQYFSKGSLIIVDGRLESRKYTDKDGNNRVAIEIKADNVYFGESKENKNAAQPSAAPVAPAGNGGDFVPDFSAVEDMEDDDLPFDEFPPFPG